MATLAILGLTTIVWGENSLASDPSSAPPGGDATLPDDLSSMTLEQVYQAVDGLEGEERFNILLEIAEAQGGTVNVYTSDIEQTNEVHVAAWHEDTGLDQELFRESSSANLERLLQENAAGEVNADTVLLNPGSMWPAVEEGLCAVLPEHLPSAEGIMEGGVYDNWVVSQLALYLPVWNTDRVAEADVPTTWAEVFDGRYDGTLGLEPTAWNRFAFIIQSAAEEAGVSVEEAVELVRPGFQNGRVVPGHSALQGMINTGELDMSVQYQPVADPDIAAGAPVSYRPAITPIPAEGVGLCILDGAPHPAAALLYLDWRLTTGMALAYEATSLVGSNPEYTPPAHETVGVDPEDVVIIPETIYQERDKWQAIVDDLVSEASSA